MIAIHLTLITARSELRWKSQPCHSVHTGPRWIFRAICDTGLIRVPLNGFLFFLFLQPSSSSSLFIISSSWTRLSVGLSRVTFSLNFPEFLRFSRAPVSAFCMLIVVIWFSNQRCCGCWIICQLRCQIFVKHFSLQRIRVPRWFLFRDCFLCGYKRRSRDLFAKKLTSN